MKETELKPFKCDNGRVYNFPEKHCAFCKNCTHVLYDYTNGPYLFLCDRGENDFQKCGKFKSDEEETDSEWISVDDDLPNVNKTLSRSESVGVIACIEGRDTKYVSYRIYERVSGRKKTVYRWKYPWDTISDEKITHWMPLPEAPKMEGGAELRCYTE